MAKLYSEDSVISGTNNENIERTLSVYENALKKYKYSKKVWLAYVVYVLNHNTLKTVDGKAVDIISANIKAAKELHARALLSLEPHKHIFLLLQFTIAIYSAAANLLVTSAAVGKAAITQTVINIVKLYVEHARQQLEDCLMKMPKRNDIRNVFMDQETKFLKSIVAIMESCGISNTVTSPVSALRLAVVNFIRLLYNKSVAGPSMSLASVKSLFKKFLSFEITYGTSESQAKVKELAKEYISRQ